MLAPLRPALRDLVRFDRSQITYVRPLQNAVGVTIPLLVGAATGNLAVGLAASIGALNVCFSDRPGPYGLRAGRMLAVTVVGSLSALAGGLAGPNPWLSVLLIALWSFGGGLLVLYGPAAEQVGLTAIILLIIYSGFGLSAHDTLIQAGFVAAGGALQTVLSVGAWPLRQFGPERQALAALFRQLAASSRGEQDREGAPAATAETTAARTTLTGLGSAHTAPAEALRVLLNEAERIRLELVALDLLRDELPDSSSDTPVVRALDRFRQTTGDILDALAGAVGRGGRVQEGASLLERAEQDIETLREAGASAAVLRHAEALLGQLRACVDVAETGTGAGVDKSVHAAATRARPLRPEEPLSILRANLTLRSTSFRHALRLAATLAVAVALGRWLGVTRAYWVPLTAAIVLKPDFTSTFSRGILRITGTMLGLGLATLLVFAARGELYSRIALIGVLTLLIRSIGPVNFGVSTIAVTALVVLLLSFVGASAETIIGTRALDTLIGGVLALGAYAVWPSWERERALLVLADMLDAYRRYFDGVMSAYQDPERLRAGSLDQLRLEARLARSNAEASIERMHVEPAPITGGRELADGILANSHRFVLSAMSIEAALYSAHDSHPPAHLDRFVQDVDTCLEGLAAALRDSLHLPATLPDLRADQSALAAEANGAGELPPLLLETERITNSVNTMLDLVRRRDQA